MLFLLESDVGLSEFFCAQFNPLFLSLTLAVHPPDDSDYPDQN